MKFATIASICLAAATTAAPRSASAAGFDELMSLVEQLTEEATALSTRYGGMDAEITSLLEQLSRCEEGAAGGGGTGSDEDEPPVVTPAPTDSSSGGDGGGVEENGGMDKTTPSPSAPAVTPDPMNDDPEDDTTTSGGGEEEEEEETNGGGGGGSGGDFKFFAGQSWNYNLATPVNTDVDVDVFFIDMDGAQATIDKLQGKGKGVVCYISIGTVEDWRDDAGQFPSGAIGGGVEGWAGEKWLDVNDMTVREIMTERVEKAKSMNCDAIEPDNMMVYSERGTGIDVTEAEQIEYNTWFAKLVHSHGMAVGLKNAVELVPILVGDYDFALNEECHEWDECNEYEDTFLAQGKPVFNVEYNLGMSVCDSSNKMGLDTIVKGYDLDAAFCSCVDSKRDVDCRHR